MKEVVLFDGPLWAMMYIQKKPLSPPAEADDCKISVFLEFELALNQKFPRLFYAIPNIVG